MFRYVGIIWNDGTSEHAVTANTLGKRLLRSTPDWNCTLKATGVQVYCAGHQGTCREWQLDGWGVVLGTLHHRSAASGLVTENTFPTTSQCQKIVDSKGKTLIEAYWGNYVALLRGPGDDTVRVLKDPTGSLPCFVTQTRGLTIVFSCIADVVALGLSFAANVTYLESRLTLNINPNDRDALTGVSRVYGGECLSIERSTDGNSRMTREFYWTPTAFPQSDRPIDNPDEAAEAMRSAVRDATLSLARQHNNLLLRLSGGLDSSIIAGCLRDLSQERQITCYTYFTPRGRSSELRWARLAAAHCGLELVEHPVGAESLHLPLLRSTVPTVEPPMGLMHLQKMTLEEQLTKSTGATAVFSGDGGDGVFGSHSKKHALADQLSRNGIQRDTLRFASQLARMSELSTLAVLMRALREWMSGQTADESAENDLQVCMLINEDLRRRVGRGATRPHPWLRNTRVSPGLEERLGALVYVVEYYYGSDQVQRRAEELAPLYCQPVMETLLRIPLYVLCESGRDRGLARRAFTQEVPAPILLREWKDRAPGVHYEVIQRNLPFLREMLLDGVLVRDGWLNGRAVEHSLSGDPSRVQVYPAEILIHLDTEIWARRWLHSIQCSAAA